MYSCFSALKIFVIHFTLKKIPIFCFSLFATLRKLLPHKFRLLLFILTFSLTLGAKVSEFNEPRNHEITLYVIPSAVPLIWESPASLYQSFFRGYISKFLNKEKYLLGHLFIKISTPLLEKPLYTGICSASGKEKKQLVLRDRVGLAILGLGLKGRLETEDDLIRKIGHYSKKNELASITYQVSEESVNRILDFYKIFSTGYGENFFPSKSYGGAFWPRYEYEGAGCTSLGLAMLDVVHLLGEESEEWKISVNIPMELIGGELNNHHKIRRKKIIKTRQWDEGSGREGYDYVDFNIYDPSLMFKWIKIQCTRQPGVLITGYLPDDRSGFPALIADRRNTQVSGMESLVLKRPENNFFIDHFHKKTGIKAGQ